METRDELWQRLGELFGSCRRSYIGAKWSYSAAMDHNVSALIEDARHLCQHDGFLEVALIMLNHGLLRAALVNVHYALGLPARRVGSQSYLIIR
jgi:hypothetical protein